MVEESGHPEGGGDGARNSESERIADTIALMVRHSRLLFACKEFERNKPEDESGADQRLFAKRGASDAKMVMRQVRHRVCDNRRARRREKECDRSVRELLHQ